MEKVTGILLLVPALGRACLRVGRVRGTACQYGRQLAQLQRTFKVAGFAGQRVSEFNALCQQLQRPLKIGAAFGRERGVDAVAQYRQAQGVHVHAQLMPLAVHRLEFIQRECIVVQQRADGGGPSTSACCMKWLPTAMRVWRWIGQGKSGFQRAMAW